MKRIIPLICLVLILSLLATGCAVPNEETETTEIETTETAPSEETSPPAAYHRLSQPEAKEIIDGSEPYILVDVRTKEEYDEKHMIGAILIPNTEMNFQTRMR